MVSGLIVGILRIVRLWWGGAVWNCMRLLVGLVLTLVVERKFALVWVGGGCCERKFAPAW